MKKTEKIYDYVNRWSIELAMIHFKMSKRQIKQYYVIGKKSLYETCVLKSKKARLAASMVVLSELDSEVKRISRKEEGITTWSLIWRGI